MQGISFRASQNISKPPITKAETKTQPKKKMSKTTKILIGTGTIAGLTAAAIGGKMIVKHVKQNRELDDLVERIARELEEEGLL